MNTIIIPIVEVLIMEDRARIKRKIRTKLPVGQSGFFLSGVSPVLVDKSLNIYTSEQDTVKILESRMEREYKIQNKNLPDDYAAVERDALKIREQIAEYSGNIESSSHELSLLQQTLDLSLSELPVDVRRGVLPGDELERELSQIQSRMAKLHKQIMRFERNITELNQNMEQRTLLLNSMQTPSTFLDCSIVFEVLSEVAMETEICLEYIVPNVLWRPSYRGELNGDKLKFESQGCVWQNTGEDWIDVQLFFSTQRSSLGINPPLLYDDIISIEKRAKEQIVEIREETVESSGLGQSSRASAELPGIDDGGDVLLIPALQKNSIPTNGRPYKVITWESETIAETELIAFPEMSPYVFSRTVQENTSPFPILAGPVDLIRDNCFLGKTSLLFISSGEPYHLAWGHDPELRMVRTQDENRKKKSLGSWEEVTYKTVLYISNIGSTEKQIKIQERIPVSEVESVKVSFESETIDEKGMFYRTLSLKPYGHERIEHMYVLKKASKVSGV